MKNSQLIYLKKPDSSFPANIETVFEVRESFISVKNLYDGEYLVQVEYVSVDPVMRVWLSGAETYFFALKPGDVMHCFGIGRVVFSKNAAFQVGEKVFGNLGIQNYSIMDKLRSKTAFHIPDSTNYPIIEIKDYLALVNNGMAAYMGFVEVCKPQAKETVLVSTAAGYIQNANKGCKVIGITGSDKKVEYLKNVIKVDEVINYKTENIADRLKNTKIDIYFDNVGGETLDLAIKSMNQHGRIALCGAIDNYNDYNNRKGIQNILLVVLKSITIRGFTFAELGFRMPEIMEQYFSDIQKGDLKLKFDEYNNIRELPQAIQHCFQGNNIGKIVVKISNISFQQACEEFLKNSTSL